MGKLFKYLFKHWKIMIVVVVVLIGQAASDLTLPMYTADIVNVGIQQSGINDKIPKQISVGTMNDLLLFLSDADAKTVMSHYTEDDSSFKVPAYVLHADISQDPSKIEALQKILDFPMLLTSGFQSGSDVTKKLEDGLKQQMQSAGVTVPSDATAFDLLKLMPSSGREQFVQSVREQMKDLPDMIIKQAGIAFVTQAYAELGIDLTSIQYQYLFRTGGIMIALAFASMIASVVVGFLGARIGASTGRELRSRIFRKVVGFSHHELNTFSTASLITRSTNDVQQIQLILVMMNRMVIYAPILAIGGIWKVFHTNADMSWIIAVAVGCLLLIVFFLFLVAMPKFKLMQKLVDRLNLVGREILTGLSVIRAFHTEKHEEERFDVANQELTNTNLFVNRTMTVMMPMMMFIMQGVSVLIVWVGSHGVNAGQMQVGDMLAFISYTMQIIISFLMLAMISIMLPRAGVAATRVEEVLSSETLIHDPEQPKHFDTALHGVVQFDHVYFRYPEAEEDALRDINFTAKPGETTAFIGSTGCGKSTLIHLLPRFYDVTAGSITIDGVDIRDVSQHELREQIGYVPQKGVLFSGDIKSNILFGVEDGSDELMRKAAEVSQATHFIESKTEGYQSHIAQGGSNVSGGQKQRLSIARAVAKNPPIYLFDDSFSALDYRTDVNLRAALKEYTGNSTVLIVAQRISTILHADQIIVLEDGEIVGKGTHEELLLSCEAYQEIASSQLSEAELAGGSYNSSKHNRSATPGVSLNPLKGGA